MEGSGVLLGVYCELDSVALTKPQNPKPSGSGCDSDSNVAATVPVQLAVARCFAAKLPDPKSCF